MSNITFALSRLAVNESRSTRREIDVYSPDISYCARRTTTVLSPEQMSTALIQLMATFGETSPTTETRFFVLACSTGAGNQEDQEDLDVPDIDGRSFFTIYDGLRSQWSADPRQCAVPKSESSFLSRGPTL